MTRLPIRALVIVPAAVLLMAACSANPGNTTGTSAPTTVSASITTSVPATTIPVTTIPVQPAPTTAAAITTTAVTPAVTVTVAPSAPAAATDCNIDGTLQYRYKYPEIKSSMVGTEADVGDHGCYERFVLRLGGKGDFPGHWVRYTDAPVKNSAGESFDVEGTAFVLVSIGTEWIFPDGYADMSRRLDTSGLKFIKTARHVESIDGTSTWVLGLDTKRILHVFALPDPPRLVVDIHYPSAA